MSDFFLSSWAWGNYSGKQRDAWVSNRLPDLPRPGPGKPPRGIMMQGTQVTCNLCSSFWHHYQKLPILERVFFFFPFLQHGSMTAFDLTFGKSCELLDTLQHQEGNVAIVWAILKFRYTVIRDHPCLYYYKTLIKEFRPSNFPSPRQLI